MLVHVVHTCDVDFNIPYLLLLEDSTTFDIY